VTLTLILTRHAKSDWGSPALPDYDRPLNDRGRRSAPVLGRWLAEKATGRRR
jgi:phosphohistidine phosphatase